MNTIVLSLLAYLSKVDTLSQPSAQRLLHSAWLGDVVSVKKNLVSNYICFKSVYFKNTF